MAVISATSSFDPILRWRHHDRIDVALLLPLPFQTSADQLLPARCLHRLLLRPDLDDGRPVHARKHYGGDGCHIRCHFRSDHVRLLHQNRLHHVLRPDHCHVRHFPNPHCRLFLHVMGCVVAPVRVSAPAYVLCFLLDL